MAVLEYRRRCLAKRGCYRSSLTISIDNNFNLRGEIAMFIASSSRHALSLRALLRAALLPIPLLLLLFSVSPLWAASTTFTNQNSDKNAALTAATDACKASGCTTCAGGPGECPSVNNDRLARGRGEPPYRCTVTCNAPPAKSFAGKGPAGCTDKRCWQAAVTASVEACKASGCTSCTTSRSAGDNCVFANGYTCNSTCSQK